MLAFFNLILSTILFFVPILIFSYNVFSFYFFGKFKCNQKITSDNLKLFKDKYIEIKVPRARKNLEAQTITGHQNITADLLEYLLDKNIKKLNFTLYLCRNAIDYLHLKRMDAKDDSSNLILSTTPPIFFNQVKVVLPLVFTFFVAYFWASSWLIELFVTCTCSFAVKYLLLTFWTIVLLKLVIEIHKYRCLSKLQSDLEDLD